MINYGNFVNEIVGWYERVIDGGLFWSCSYRMIFRVGNIVISILRRKN